jgi:hypothetical protein
MISKFLLPTRFKLLGWFLFLPSFILGLLSILFFDFELKGKMFALVNDNLLGDNPKIGLIKTDIFPTIIGTLVLIGALLIGFSKEKNEDEYISSLRLNALSWAVIINYVVVIFCFLFVYGLSFLSVMMYNLFTVLLIFIIRFNFLLYVNKRQMI